MNTMTKNTERKKQCLLLGGLVAIVLLIGLSVYGSFIGADNAQTVFNSIPLSVYWVVFVMLLMAAIILFRQLMRFPGLLMMHLGCVLVLVGALWGSRAGFKMQDALIGADTIREGSMCIYEGRADNAVETEQGETKTLPFAVRLIDFGIEYYEPGQLVMQTPNNATETVPAKPGAKYTLTGNWGSIEIIRKFEHFKLIIQDDKKIATDDPNNTPNPALELRLTRPDGSQVTRYVFERFGGRHAPEGTLQFRYQRMARAFFSDIEIVKNNTILVRKRIEVNNPLHFGGYLFYQQGYDDEAGKFTVLRVTSDRGLGIVFLGYLLLCAGIFWHLWFRHFFHRTISMGN